MENLDRMVQSEIELAIETLLKGRETGTVSATVARSIIGRAVQRIRAYERDSVLMGLMSTKDVAQYYGVSARRVRAKAQWLRQRGQPIGWQVPGTTVWLFGRHELEALAPMAGGRPTDNNKRGG